MSGLASAALAKQTSHRERGGSSPMEPSSSETLSGSASHPLPCAVPAGIETATGSPLKINHLVCSCCDQIGEDTRKKTCKYGKETTEGAGSATTTPCATGILSGTVKKDCRWGKKLKPLQSCGSTRESDDEPGEAQRFQDCLVLQSACFAHHSCAASWSQHTAAQCCKSRFF